MLVSNPEEGVSEFYPSMDMNPEGDFIIAFKNNNEEALYAQLYHWGEENPIRYGGMVKINEQEYDRMGKINVELNASGDVLFVFSAALEEKVDVYAKKYFWRENNFIPDGQGTFKVSERYGDLKFTSWLSVSSDMDENGNFIIAWGKDQSNNDNRIDSYMRVYDTFGLAMTEEIMVNVFTNSYQENPQIALNEQGDFVIVWNGSGEDRLGNRNESSDIYGRYFHINFAPHAPVISKQTVYEHQEAGTWVADISLSDDNEKDTLSLRLLSIDGIPLEEIAEVERAFFVVQEEGKWLLRMGKELSRLEQASYLLELEVIDGATDDALTYTGSYSINVEEEAEEPTAVPDAISRSVHLYPNPTRHQCYIDLGAFSGKNIQLTVRDFLGKVYRQGSVKGDHKMVLDLTDWPLGMYFLELNEGHHVVVKKIIRN